jgi:hypothetical protein
MQGSNRSGKRKKMVVKVRENKKILINRGMYFKLDFGYYGDHCPCNVLFLCQASQHQTLLKEKLRKKIL